MKKKAIDPSEIITGRDGTIRNDTTIASPWIRLIARLFDYSLFFLSLYSLHRLSGAPLPFGKWESWVPCEYLIWIPLEAGFLWAFGKTPGKWLLRIDLRQGNRTRPEYMSALMRSSMVWFRGIGMGIPFVGAFCMFIAYQRLKTAKITSWDRDTHFQVVYRPISNMRLGIAAFIAIAGLLFFFIEKRIEFHRLTLSSPVQYGPQYGRDLRPIAQFPLPTP